MRNKLLVVALVLFLIITCVYLFIRFGFLKSKDFKPDASKEKNILDLRPAIIAKLQQLVKDGSDGLYILSVEELEPHLLTSKLDASKVSIRIDSAVMRHLDSLHLLPDDIFTFNFSALHVDGIGIDDLLHKDRINITGIHITDPVINMYHKKRSYNAADRKQSDTLSLYEKLKGNLKKIAIGKIDIEKGTFINHDLVKNKSSKFNDVSILINDLLIDSSTQFDKSRFLFAKQATIHTKNYSIPTADSLYFFKADDISIAGEQHMITALNVALTPRYKRQEFEKKVSSKTDMYQFAFSKVILKDVDWMAMINNESFIAKSAAINGGTFSDFLDRSLPSSKAVSVANFPHQMLMRLPFKISVDRVDVKNINISYEEFNPASAQSGTAYFDNINGRINHISNIPAEIKVHPLIEFSASTLFMHHVPANVKFTFDLSKYKSGDFSLDITMDSFDNVTINKIAEPLGLFSVKTGLMQRAEGHIRGNNFYSNNTLALEYTDLHITPLKQDKDEKGKLKSMKITSLLANFLFVKNNNQKGKDLRQPAYTVQRGKQSVFFNFIWKSILTGILKTIGVPVKLILK